MEKEGTSTNSKESAAEKESNPPLLRKGNEVPQLRTAGAIIEKHEQIQDALERRAITGKIAEQMNQTLKGIVGIAKLELQYHSLSAKLGRAAPVPRSPLLRSVVGLAPELPAPKGDE